MFDQKLENNFIDLIHCKSMSVSSPFGIYSFPILTIILHTITLFTATQNNSAVIKQLVINRQFLDMKIKYSNLSVLSRREIEIKLK